MKTSGTILLLLLGCMAILPSLSQGQTQLQESSKYMRSWRPRCLRGEAQWWILFKPRFVAPCVFNDPEIKQCIRNTLRPVPGCMHSVFQSFVDGKVNLSLQCCHAVNLLSEDCFAKVFVYSYPLRHAFGPSVRKFCALANDGDALSPAPK